MPDHFFFFLYVFFSSVPFAGFSDFFLTSFRFTTLIFPKILFRTPIGYTPISADVICYAVGAINRHNFIHNFILI